MHPASRRNTVAGILDAVVMGGKIRIETLQKLIALLERKTDYHVHIELAVLVPGGLLNLDNEDDAQETIRRLEDGHWSVLNAEQAAASVSERVSENLSQRRARM
jgi:hypothetical protein